MHNIIFEAWIFVLALMNLIYLASPCFRAFIVVVDSFFIVSHDTIRCRNAFLCCRWSISHMIKHLSMFLSLLVCMALTFLLFAPFPLRIDVFQQWIYQYLKIHFLTIHWAIDMDLLRIMLATLQIFSVHLRVLCHARRNYHFWIAETILYKYSMKHAYRKYLRANDAFPQHFSLK